MNWPEDIVVRTDTAVLTNVPRKKLVHIAGKAWKNFGGGDAANSGGANYLASDEPYPPVDVFGLRNHSIIPPTQTSDRWTEAFQATGFKQSDPPPVKLDDKDLVSQPSSLRTEDGRDRLLLADDLRYNTENRKGRYVHDRAASVVRERDGHNTSRAIGVRGGVRIDNDQNEYGGCVVWKARLAVVLSGGIFTTFDLLVETGIGQKKHLETRKIPEDWWTPNEDVGTRVGDEHTVVYVGVEPEISDPFGAQPRLIAEDDHGNAYEFWTKGLETWLAVKTYLIVNKLMPRKFPILSRFKDWLLNGSAMWAVGILADPILELDAVPKPLNATQRGD